MLNENEQMVSLGALATGHTSSSISYADALENYRKNTDWWTVFATFDLPNFNPSPLWISKKTGLSVEEVVEALEGFAILGYLKKENGDYLPVKGKEFAKVEYAGKTKAEIFAEHTLVSRQILNQVHPETSVVLDHKFFAANIEIMNELYNDINTAFQKAFLRAQGNKSKNDSVFKITFTGVDVLKRPSSDERGQ